MFINSLRLTATEALKHKWVKRRPQYYPTKTNVSTTNDFQFHPVPLETVNKKVFFANIHSQY